MRLIDADALMDKLLLTAVIADDKGVEKEYYFSKDLIQKAPTIDAVPVTRCAECVWYVARELKYDGTPDKRYKPSWCELWRAEMKGNDYCSRGEKK